MKRSPLAVTLLCLLGTHFAAAQTPDFPKRKAGLWEMRMESTQMPAGMNSLQCIDEKTDAEMQRKALAGGNDKSDCKMLSSQKTANGWTYDSVCKTKDMTITSHTELTGDMQSAYQMAMLTRFDPPMMGKTEMRSTLKVSYQGACKPGMKPGDISINGMTLNMQSGANGGKPAMSQEDLKKMIESLQKSK